MRLKKTLPLQHGLITFFHDTVSVYLLLQTPKNFICSVLDIDTLDPFGSFLIKDGVTSSTTYLSNDVLYLTTNEGILGYDSFSGLHTVRCISDNLIPLDFCCGNNTIYAVCGIPIVNNKQINTDNICLASYSFATGKCLSQGQSISGSFISPVHVDGNTWCIVGQNLYKYNNNSEITKTIQLSFTPTYPPVFGHNFICVASEDGHMEIFSEGSHKYLKIFIEKNHSAPVCIDPDTVAWAGLEHLHIVHVGRRSSEKIPLNSTVSSSIVYLNGIIYAGDKSGNLVSINVDTKAVSYMPVSNTPLWKPIISDNYVFVASQTGFHQCQIT